MQTVRDLLARKPAKIVMIDPRCTVLQTLLKMAEHGVGALLVANSDGNLAGIVTERDFAKGAAKFQDMLLQRPISDLMTGNLITCDIGDGIVDALSMMNSSRIRHLPVVDGGEVVGFLSIRDMLVVCVEAMKGEDNKLQRQLLNASWSAERPDTESWLTA